MTLRTKYKTTKPQQTFGKRHKFNPQEVYKFTKPHFHFKARRNDFNRKSNHVAQDSTKFFHGEPRC